MAKKTTKEIEVTEYVDRLVAAGLPEAFSIDKMNAVMAAVDAKGLTPAMALKTIDKGIKRFITIIGSLDSFEGTCVGVGEPQDSNYFARTKALAAYKADKAGAIRAGNVMIDPVNDNVIPLHNEKEFKSGAPNFNYGKEIFEKLQRTLYFIIDGELVMAKADSGTATIGTLYKIYGKQKEVGKPIYLNKAVPLIDMGENTELITALSKTNYLEFDELQDDDIGSHEIIKGIVSMSKNGDTNGTEWGMIVVSAENPDIPNMTCFSKSSSVTEDIGNEFFDVGDDVYVIGRLKKKVDAERGDSMELELYGAIKDDESIDKDTLGVIGKLFG